MPVNITPTFDQKKKKTHTHTFVKHHLSWSPKPSYQCLMVLRLENIFLIRRPLVPKLDYQPRGGGEGLEQGRNTGPE